MSLQGPRCILEHDPIPIEILERLPLGDTVMFSIEQGEYYGLNAIGTRIWHLLEKEMSVQEICTILRSEYDVSDTQ